MYTQCIYIYKWYRYLAWTNNHIGSSLKRQLILFCLEQQLIYIFCFKCVCGVSASLKKVWR